MQLPRIKWKGAVPSEALTQWRGAAWGDAGRTIGVVAFQKRLLTRTRAPRHGRRTDIASLT